MSSTMRLAAGNLDTTPLDAEQLVLLHTMVRFIDTPPAGNGSSEMMLIGFLFGIKTGHWRKLIDVIRNTPVTDPVTPYFLPERHILPGVVFARHFNEGVPPVQISKHTGLMGVYFDSNVSPGMTDTEIKEILVKDPHVVACWKPVERKGIEGIVRIRPDFEFHKKSFTAADAHYQKLGLKIDAESWNNPSRRCQVSDDPDLWINPKPVIEINPEGLANEELDAGNDDSTPFPMSCLPGVAGEMAKEIARVTTSGNEALAAASIIGVVSAALGAGIEFSAGGERRTRANLYLMVIAESGTGKGETFDLATASLIAFERDAMEAFQRNQLPNLNSELNVITIRVNHLALVLHCAEHGVRAHEIPISQQSAHNAVQVMRWFSGRQLSLLNAGRRECLEKRVSKLREILESGDKSVRQLERSYGFKKGEIERLNLMYPKHFHIASVKPPGGGRPSLMASVHSRAMIMNKLETRIR